MRTIPKHRALRSVCLSIGSVMVLLAPNAAVGQSSGFGFIAIVQDDPASAPADPELAVGSTHLVAVTNQDLVVYDRTGQELYKARMFGASGFWGELPACPSFMPAPSCFNGQDPLVFYDDEEDRFWLTAMEDKLTVLIAVSGSDPSVAGDWKKFRVNPLVDYPGEFKQFWGLDRPNASIHDDEVYISYWGFFCPDPSSTIPLCNAPTGPELRGAVIVLDKNEMLSPLVQTGDPLSNINAAWLPGPDDFPPTRGSWRQVTPFHGVKADVTDSTPLYMIEIDFDYPAQPGPNPPRSQVFQEIVLHALTNPWSAVPTVDTEVLELPANLKYYGPKEMPVGDNTHGYAPQLGTDIRVQLTDARILDAVYRDGYLWAAHHVRKTVNSNNVIRWYRFAMNGFPNGTPQLSASGTIDPPGSAHAYYPSLAVNDTGTAMLTYNRSGLSEYISIRRRNLSTGDDQLVKLSFEPYIGDNPKSELMRWGDYSGTEPDPNDPCGFWGIHLYTGEEVMSAAAAGPPTGDDKWRTYIYNWTDWPNCVTSGPSGPERLGGASFIADVTGDGQVDLFDVVEFMNRFSREDRMADLTRDGQWDVFDFLKFQEAFNEVK